MNSSTFPTVSSIYPEVAEFLTFEACVQYIELVQILKPAIEIYLEPDEEGPLPLERLPLRFHRFLIRAVGIEHEIGKHIWMALSPVAWALPPRGPSNPMYQHIQVFLDYGYEEEIAFYHFAPPVTTCLEPDCLKMRRASKSQAQRERKRRHCGSSSNILDNQLEDYATSASEKPLPKRSLTASSTIDVTVFTQDLGPIPGRSTSMYCNVCHTRYYLNYYVNKDKNTRTYYADSHSFDYIHVAEHVFIETRTLNLFTSMMLNAWTSASNCAQIYNEGVALRSLAPTLPLNFPKSFVMDTEDVWDGLMLYWLLEDAYERGEVLETLHIASSQSKRVQPALHARNVRMAGTGQEEWNHICDVCCYESINPDGSPDYIRSCVTDGITIGRPTCSVQDCPLPLKTTRDRYCPSHKKEDLVCVVTTCSNPAEKGHRTCALAEHRQVEEYNAEHNKAMFQLKHRLAKLKTSHNNFSEPGNTDPDEEEEIEVNVHQSGRLCNDKPEKGNKSLRARFGRRRTHNEELCVASCGIILGRCTFYGSEAPNGVRTFWKKLFPYKRALPRILWHDNNCRIMAMLRKRGEEDHYFDSCALPVDVFHFKSKHKETDEDCNRHCNPAQWEILETAEKKWRFNSSIAEQTNAWIGGYQSIVREMEADRYEFFLDEMIKRKNQQLIARLERQHKRPRAIPRSELLRPGTPPPLRKRSPEQIGDSMA